MVALPGDTSNTSALTLSLLPARGLMPTRTSQGIYTHAHTQARRTSGGPGEEVEKKRHKKTSSANKLELRSRGYMYMCIFSDCVTLVGLLILKRALALCPTVTLLNTNLFSSSPYTPTQPSC